MNAKENTFRALEGKTLLVKSWKCSVKWHKWTMWMEAKEHTTEYYRSRTQKRYCINCNLREDL